jgi:hypothetical protein
MARYGFEEEKPERLAGIEATWDPGTWALLESIGVGPGWRCLEAGAGGGSIAAWMAERVGPDGSVLATDIDTTHLEPLGGGVLEVRRHTCDATICPSSHSILFTSGRCSPGWERAMRLSGSSAQWLPVGGCLWRTSTGRPAGRATTRRRSPRPTTTSWSGSRASATTATTDARCCGGSSDQGWRRPALRDAPTSCAAGRPAPPSTVSRCSLSARHSWALKRSRSPSRGDPSVPQRSRKPGSLPGALRRLGTQTSVTPPLGSPTARPAHAARRPAAIPLRGLLL